jgi:hypothetical protein
MEDFQPAFILAEILALEDMSNVYAFPFAVKKHCY